MKDMMRSVVEELKANLPMDITVKIDGEQVEVEVLEIDDINVKYNLDGEIDLMKFKDFRSDLMRYNRYLVDYIVLKKLN